MNILNDWALLPWLKRINGDWNTYLASISFDDELESTKSLFKFSQHYLDTTKLWKLSKVCNLNKQKIVNTNIFQSLKIAYISNGTSDFVISGIVGTALRHSIHISIEVPNYGQVEQALMNNELQSEDIDIVVLALDHRFYGLSDKNAGSTSNVSSAIDRINNLVELSKKISSTIIVQTLPSPPEKLFGSLDLCIDGTCRSDISKFNKALVEVSSHPGVVLFDVASLAEALGTTRWFNIPQWLTTKVLFSQDLIPIYCEQLIKIISSLYGKTKKCLILDLDNTLWGGVIGDDGLEGIKLGNGSALGEAYLSIQRMALNLRSRGIILAVCSKNSEDIALTPFKELADMLLKRDHFALFVANWNDKASNIKIISQKLNLDLSSLVFLDDNPAERDQVRMLLPSVAVPEVPNDPAIFPRLISMAGYFETISFTDEDIKRSDMYQANMKRNIDLNSSKDLSKFLSKLNMKLIYGKVNKINVSRVSQLINKTNQFNLTTKRYTESEVIKMVKSSNYYMIQGRLSDIYGDNGLITIISCHQASMDVWEIDLWLMSCRVLGREVESEMLNILVRSAKENKIQKIRGFYIPTNKNKLVENHYKIHGFSFEKKLSNNVTIWILDVMGYKEKNNNIFSCNNFYE